MSTIRLLPAYQWVVGEPVVVDATFVTQDDIASDPDTITITLILPDGTVEAFTKSDLTRLSTGIYRFTYTTDQSGRYQIRIESTGTPTTATEQFFDVGYSSFI